MQATKSRRASEPAHRISAGASHQSRKISSSRSQKENEQHSLCRNQVLEGRPSQIAHMESQLKELKDELKRAKDQLASSEACRKNAQQEAEETKIKLYMMSSKFEDSQRQLIDLSSAEDYRIHELHKISQERDKAWQSELEALQNQQSNYMAAWSSVTKEMQKLKSQIELLKVELVKKDSFIESLKVQIAENKGADELLVKGLTNGSTQTESELNEAKSVVADLKSQLVNKDAYLNNMVEMNKKLNDDIRAQVSQIEAEFSSKISRSMIDISYLTIEFGQTKSELQSELKEAKVEITELKSKLVNNDAYLRTIIDMNTKLKDDIRAKLSQEEAEFSSNVVQSAVSDSELTFESSQTELELESELMEAKSVIAELNSKLVNMDADLRSLLDANEKLNDEIRAQVNQEAEFSSKIMQAAIDISELKTKLTDKDAEFEPIEAELKRVKAHSNQWKKAAETAAAMLMEGKNGRGIERTGSVDTEYLWDGWNMMNSPNSDDESPKSKNHKVLRVIAGLWKKS